MGIGAGFCREGAICSDNWCRAAFTQQPACLGRQYLKNIVSKLGLAGGMGVLLGTLRLAQTLPQACWPSQLHFLCPLRGRAGTYLAASPSVHLTWIPPAVISVKVDPAILCLFFSSCCLSHSGLSACVSLILHSLACPCPSNQVQISLCWEDWLGWSRQDWPRLFLHSLRCAREGTAHLVGGGHKRESLLGTGGGLSDRLLQQDPVNGIQDAGVGGIV